MMQIVGMDKTLSSLEGDFSKIRAGRAHPSLLEQINVEYYGTLVPISQVSNVVSEDSRTLKSFAMGKRHGGTN